MIQGGRLDEQSLGGVTNRNISDYPFGLSPYIASRCRHPRLISYYTADHDVDENEPTIANFGGPWRFGDVAGVSCRYVSAPIHYTENNVASLKNK